MAEPEPKVTARLIGPVPTGPFRPSVRVVGNAIFVKDLVRMLDQPRPARPIPGKRRRPTRARAKSIRRTKPK